jgi:hypothetical protein
MLMDFLKEGKKSDVYFNCSISKQWTNLLKNSIKENLILVNTKERDILFIRSINKLTGRISGLYIPGNLKSKKLSSNKNIEAFKSNLSKIISYLTWKNLPINIINVVKYTEENKLNKLILNLNTYKIAVDYNILSDYIFLTNNKLIFSKTEKKDDSNKKDIKGKNFNEKDLEDFNKILNKKKLILDKYNYKHNLIDVGLTDYENFKFYIPDEKECKKYKIDNLIL